MPRHLFLSVIFLLLGLAVVDADDSTDKPAPVAAPAFVGVVVFHIHTEGENHKTVVTSGPTEFRVDEPDDGYSIIYDPETDHYTGLEHRNYTYWEFSWGEVKDQIETSRRYETRLRDLNTEGLNGYSQPSTATNTANLSLISGPDDTGYVWRSTDDKKRIAGLDCTRWTGESVGSEDVDAWCCAGPLPQMAAAMEHMRTINEPVALVPVRQLFPALVFRIYDGLVKAGVTPVLIQWGSDQDKNTFAYLESKTRDGKLSLFTVPKLYVKTTLVTMDGMLNQKK